MNSLPSTTLQLTPLVPTLQRGNAECDTPASRGVSDRRTMNDTVTRSNKRRVITQGWPASFSDALRHRNAGALPDGLPRRSVGTRKTRKRHPSPAKARGMTLLELTVVLLILVALAGVVLPYTSGISQQAQCDATDASMVAIRNAIMGGGVVSGFYIDTLGNYPNKENGNNEYKLHYLFDKGNWRKYNPKTKFGWNGPYLMTGATVVDPTPLDTGDIDDPYDPTFSNSTYTSDVNVDDSIILDGWGRPIVLQVLVPADPDDPDKTRLVSAGPGTGWGANEAAINTTIADVDADNRVDDRVLFLKTTDPSTNASCK